MFSKVKHRLFFSFLLFSSFFILSTLASTWLYKQKDRISGIVRTLDEVYILILKDFKVQQQFLTYETIDPLFFKTGKSLKIEEHNHILAEIAWKLKLLSSDQTIGTLKMPVFVDALQREFKEYRRIFDRVVINLLKRGFKDYGIEGEMRDYAHALMNIKELNQEDVLMLRRHEKDFIIRKEYQYVTKFNAVINTVKDEIRRKQGLSSKRREQMFFIVDSYAHSFAKLVAAEKILGLREQSGLMLSLTSQSNKLESMLDKQKAAAAGAEARIFRNLLITAAGIIIIISILSVMLSYWVAVVLTMPVVKLSRYMEEYVSSNFTKLPDTKSRTSRDEIGILMSNFFRMAEEISDYINYFREKVEERTAEINKQNREIVDQKKQIIQQRDELAAKTEILELQQKLVTEKNKSILDSIRYAERIQQAILPPADTIRQALPDSFVYFQPRDIVSGDFYWIDEVMEVQAGQPVRAFAGKFYQDEEEKPETSRKVLFAAVDCTGHGVPGALMSIVGHNSLNKIVLEHKLTKPSAILNQLDKEVKRTLRQRKKDTIRDGMDIALCCLDRETGLLQFAGANNPLYVINNGQLREIKGNKYPIGMHIDGEEPDFLNHELYLEKRDVVYIFSDGYVDQFGGPDSKKFKRKQFQELLLSIHELEMQEQQMILRRTLEEWKGTDYQVDDILVIGVKI